MRLTEVTSTIESLPVGPIEQIYAPRASKRPASIFSRRDRGAGSGANRSGSGQITSQSALAGMNEADDDGEIIPDASDEFFDYAPAALQDFDDILIDDDFGALGNGGGSGRVSKSKKTFDNWVQQESRFADDQKMNLDVQAELNTKRREGECALLQGRLNEIHDEGKCPTCGTLGCKSYGSRRVQYITLFFAHNLELRFMQCPK
jgi:hypothetical protein